MGRRINKIITDSVISEPGDMTQYRYLAVPVATNYTVFISNNDFKYPNEISHIEIAKFNNFADVVKYSTERHPDINPNTVLECINYIRSNNNLSTIKR